MSVTAEESAGELLEVVPIVMKEIRAQMRSRGSLELTIPQFRVLNFVSRNRGCSLLEVADHLGLTSPSASTLVDALIERGLMTREEDPMDRRRVRLAVTSRGKAILEDATNATLEYLAGKLAGISAEEREVVARAMKILRSLFAK